MQITSCLKLTDLRTIKEKVESDKVKADLESYADLRMQKVLLVRIG